MQKDIREGGQIDLSIDVITGQEFGGEGGSADAY